MQWKVARKVTFNVRRNSFGCKIAGICCNFIIICRCMYVVGRLCTFVILKTGNISDERCGSVGHFNTNFINSNETNDDNAVR